MPELPEVETDLRRLKPRLLGRRIERVEFRRASRLLRNNIVSGRALAQHVQGTRIKEIYRRGKYLIIKLDCGHALALHRGMTGILKVLSAGEVPRGWKERHLHARFHFRDIDLIFYDPRTFGRIVFLPQGDFCHLKGLASIGAEPLESHFTASYLHDKISSRRGKIKAVLLNQQVVAGIGNIYADESLFRAGIHPERPAHSLTGPEVKRLRQAIRQVLREAIRKNGTSIGDEVVAEGRYQPLVYDRAGEACKNCGQTIESTRARIAGRTTSFCPHCQPRRRK
ncbi:MAG: DNA-formamidopyrimidine glycosylase [Deltaproteobacteria bacterium RBG_13_61_14]|nr:MAG: DNA-formamidopyrimidine glycosylase [Deltaproteobacteria bacterium RBG_13_61_14]